MAWVNELTRYVNESAYSLRWFDHGRPTLRSPERAFVVAGFNTFAYVSQVRAWLPM